MLTEKLSYCAMHRRRLGRRSLHVQRTHIIYCIARPSGEIGRRKGLEENLSTRSETSDVNGVKFGETSSAMHVAIPS